MKVGQTGTHDMNKGESCQFKAQNLFWSQNPELLNGLNVAQHKATLAAALVYTELVLGANNP